LGGTKAPAAGAQPSAGAEPKRAPLGAWRGPAFWMSCGAVLAGLAAGAVVLVQRVGVERDLMAVATTLPPRTGPLPRTVGPSNGREPAAAVKPSDLEGPSAAESAAVQNSPQPIARDLQAPRKAASGGRKAASPKGKAGAAAATLRHSTRQVATTAARHERKNTGARRKALGAADKYAEVFKRCPPPGTPGAVECRRDICNGAESEGPACSPYRGKLR
jgi:hypothetical protein